MTRGKVAFLVGAGLVADAGLPVSTGLANRLKEHLAERASSGDELSRLHLEVYRFLNGAIRFQRGLLNRDPEGPVNIEQLATAALRLSARGESPLAPYVSAWIPKLTDLEERSPGVLQSFVSMTYERLEGWLTQADSEKIAYLKSFADFAEFGQVDIFSLNYDLCIEAAFQRLARRQFCTGFSENGWFPSLLETDSVTRLFKLHGSLDWVEDEAFGLCSLEYPRHNDAEQFEGEQLPLLIFGTDSKLTGREPFLTLLYWFSTRLAQAELLVTIGYSFMDVHINEIVQQRLRSNSKLKILIVDVNPAQAIESASFLRKNPRVCSVTKTARAGLQDSSILVKCRSLLQQAENEDSPF